MKRVMVIDDASTVRMYHKTLLEELGLFVYEANNGLEALEQALENPVELFLVDINMPKMDGFSFIREIRQRPVMWSIPAILISTEDRDSDIQAGTDAGANLYLIKPVNPEDLKRVVTLMLGGDI